jgi:hypothetical protein
MDSRRTRHAAGNHGGATNDRLTIGCVSGRTCVNHAAPLSWNEVIRLITEKQQSVIKHHKLVRRQEPITDCDDK